MFRDQSQDVIKKVKKTDTGESWRIPRSTLEKLTSSRLSSTSDDSSDWDTPITDHLTTVEDPEADNSSSVVVPSSSGYDTWDASSMDNTRMFDFMDHITQQLDPLILTRPMPSRDEGVCFFIRSGLLKHFPAATDRRIPAKLAAARGSIAHQALVSSMGAVGMALLSSLRKSRALRSAAANEFGSALTLVNSALSDSKAAMAHYTLAAVILLAVFEVCVCSNPLAF